MGRHQVRNTIVWSVLSIVIVACAIVVLGAISNDRGEPLLENPGALMGALFGSVAVLGTGAFGLWQKLEKSTEEIRVNTQVSREQLENDHTADPTKESNIRTDLDTKASKEDVMRMHNQLSDTLNGLSEQLRMHFQSLDGRMQGSASDIRGLRKDIAKIQTKQDRLDDRLDEMEKTTTHVSDTTDSIKIAVTAQ